MIRRGILKSWQFTATTTPASSLCPLCWVSCCFPSSFCFKKLHIYIIQILLYIFSYIWNFLSFAILCVLSDFCSQWCWRLFPIFAAVVFRQMHVTDQPLESGLFRGTGRTELHYVHWSVWCLHVCLWDLNLLINTWGSFFPCIGAVSLCAVSLWVATYF